MSETKIKILVALSKLGNKRGEWGLEISKIIEVCKYCIKKTYNSLKFISFDKLYSFTSHLLI